MSKTMLRFILGILSLSGCAGMKVIYPNVESKDRGTRILDLSEGGLKIVSTYSCKLQSMGQRMSAIGKTEDEARAEVLKRCHEKTLVSFCKGDKITCTKN